MPLGMAFVAEWPSGLGKGLQSPVHGFDSRLRLPVLLVLYRYFGPGAGRVPGRIRPVS